MRFRSFVTHRQQAVTEGTFRAVVDATRQQQAIKQGQLVQQADVRRAVEKCSELVEFARAVEEAVQTGDLSVVQAQATTMRGVATGLLQLLRRIGGTNR